MKKMSLFVERFSYVFLIYLAIVAIMKPYDRLAFSAILLNKSTDSLR